MASGTVKIEVMGATGILSHSFKVHFDKYTDAMTAYDSARAEVERIKNILEAEAHKNSIDK